jgi:hypothetical protein
MQVAEAFVLATIVGALYWSVTPLRHRLQRWIAARLTRTAGRRPAQVVVLSKRRDGRYTEENGHGG